MIVLSLCSPYRGIFDFLRLYVTEKQTISIPWPHAVNSGYRYEEGVFQYNIELAKEVISITTTSSFHGLDLDCGCDSGNGGGGRDGK